MKKLRRILILAVACLGVTLLFIGCASQTNSISAGTYSYYGDYPQDNLKIKVKFKSAYATGEGTNFLSKNTLPELKEQIDKQKQKGYSLETTLYGERFLLVDKTVDDHIYHYLLVRRSQTESGGWRYDFMNMVAGIGSSQSTAFWLIPYHLFGDGAYEELLYSQDSGGEFFDIKADRAYPAEHGIDDFYDFYNVIGNYTVTRGENVLTLQTQQRDKKIAIDVRFDETESGTTVTYFNSAYLD